MCITNNIQKLFLQLFYNNQDFTAKTREAQAVCTIIQKGPLKLTKKSKLSIRRLIVDCVRSCKGLRNVLELMFIGNY